MSIQKVTIWVLVLSTTGSISNYCSATAEPLFASSNQPKLSLTLKGPWSQIINDSAKDPEYRSVQLSSNGIQALGIKVKPRGKSRRHKGFCRFPPLWLNLPKKALKHTRFAGQDKLKLVTHCSRLGPKSGRVEDRLWSEFIAYRIYNLLTDTSFRVQAVEVEYQDLSGQSVGNHPGFLIEHKSSVAKRLKLTPVTTSSVRLSSLEPNNSALASLFQYFIGGVDYSLIRGPEGDKCCHNVISMAAIDEQVIGIPYDFDATGFVDPPYGAEYTGRIYRGFCRLKPGHEAALQNLFTSRPQIEELIETFPDISSARKRKLQRFIKGFYKKIPNQTKGMAWLGKNCR